MAFPRLNLLSYWVFLGGGLVMCGGFLTADGPADFGWFAYAPLSDSVYQPGLGVPPGCRADRLTSNVRSV